MYKPFQIWAPQTGNAKNHLLNRPFKYKPLGGLYSENCPQIQSKTKQRGYKQLSAPSIHGDDIIEIQVPWIQPQKSINLFMSASVSHTGPGF